MEAFNVINYDINRKKFKPYNVIPYLVRCYKETNHKPVSFEEFKKFVKSESLYQFWSRCEYEIILSDWPPSNPPVQEKWDVYQQIMMNLDIVTKILMDEVLK